ncbi:hypothetical protein, partial [Acidimangrovimonas sediminis]|uniref:hypothetical protein n=1 Tax=Acidimangrovimonas sediminis TaxID=2056283 RepID=UPI001E6135D6
TILDSRNESLQGFAQQSRSQQMQPCISGPLLPFVSTLSATAHFFKAAIRGNMQHGLLPVVSCAGLSTPSPDQGIPLHRR